MFIDNVECPEYLSLIGTVMHEVIGPYVVAMLRSQSDTRTIVQPEPPFLWLLQWHFQPLPSPQAFDPSVAD